MAQLMQQRINSLDTIGLGERGAVRQVSHDGGLGLHLDVVCQPATQFEDDIEGGEVGFVWSKAHS